MNYLLSTAAQEILADLCLTYETVYSANPEFIAELYDCLDRYYESTGGNDISPGDFADVLERKTGVSDYYLACLLIDNSDETICSGVEDEFLTEQDVLAVSAKCYEILDLI